MTKVGNPPQDGWWRRAGRSKPTRRRAAVIALFVASCAGSLAGMFFLAMQNDPPRLSVAASAVVDDAGHARIDEAIDYRYSWSDSGGRLRIGFLHVLAGSRSGVAPRLVDVTADAPVDVVSAPQGNDLAVRVTSPIDEKHEQGGESLSGVHAYRIRSTVPLVGPDGRLSWDVLGRGWDDRVEGVSARLVGPWRWVAPRCRVVGAGPGFSCSVRPGRAGELVVAAHRLPPGARLTVTAHRGAAVTRPATEEVPIPGIGEPDPTHWWSNPLTMGGLVFLAVLVPGLILGRMLRRLGRDMVPVGGFDPSGAPAPGGELSDPGMARVDDRRLAAMATPVPVPPQGCEPWQGALVRSEIPDDASRIAWFLGHLAQGRLTFARERDRDGVEDLVLVRSTTEGTSLDDVDATLDIAFAGRSRVVLGRPDTDLVAAWHNLEPLQLAWLLDAGLSDPDRARRVRRWRNTAALLGFPLLLLGFFGTMSAGMLGPIGGVAQVVLAGICGLVLTFILRVWELNVRTPLGSTWWVRVEAFRRFLSECSAEDVTRIAERAELATYTAWAVALELTDHWTSTVTAAQLPPDTPGLDTALAAPGLVRAFRAVVNPAVAQSEVGRRNRQRRQVARAAKARG